MSGGHGLSHNYYQTTNKTVRSSLFHYPGSFSSSPPLPPLTGGKKRSIRSRALLRLTDISPSSGIRGTDLVERQFGGMEREGSRFWNSRYGNRDRCFAQGLGSILHGGFHWRAMDRGGNPAPYQLSGAASGSFCHTNVCKRQSPNEGLPAYGQHDSSPLHKQDGGNKIPHSSTSGCRSVELVSRTPDSHRGSVHSRSSECTSRQGIQSHVRSSRLETRPQSLCRVKSAVGSIGSRPICFAPHRSATSLLQLATRPPRRSHGCVFTGLDLSKRVCIPTIRADRPMPAKTSGSGGVSSSTSSSSLEITTVVPVTARVMHSQSSSSTTVSRPFDTSGGNASVGSASTSRMAAISRSYSEAGISQGAQKLLVAAWRKGTSSAYSSAWGKWDSWCREREVNPVLAPIECVLEFLTHEFNIGKAYRTLNVYRSAISSTHPMIDSLRVGEHPLVVQLLKGAYNLRPPLPRYSSTWEVAKVVSFLDQLGSNGSLSLKDLSQKLGLLLALTAMERESEVIAHDLRYRQFSPEGVIFHLPELTKKSRVGHDLKRSFHASFPSNTNLCVVDCLKEYERRTRLFRPKDPTKPNKLLLSYIKPYKPISTESLSRWIKEILSRAGIDTNIFKAHSVRGASASSARNKGISLEDILRLADWSTDSTFRRFYYRPQYNPDTARQLLNFSSYDDTSPL